MNNPYHISGPALVSYSGGRRVEFSGEEDRLIAEIDGKDAPIHPGCIFEATPCSK